MCSTLKYQFQVTGVPALCLLATCQSKDSFNPQRKWNSPSICRIEMTLHRNWVFLTFSLLSAFERGKEEGVDENWITCLRRGPPGFPRLVRIKIVQPPPTTPFIFQDSAQKQEHRGKGKRQAEVKGEKYFPEYFERPLGYFQACSWEIEIKRQSKIQGLLSSSGWIFVHHINFIFLWKRTPHYPNIIFWLSNVQNKPKYVDKWMKCSGFLSCKWVDGKGGNGSKWCWKGLQSKIMLFLFQGLNSEIGISRRILRESICPNGFTQPAPQKKGLPTLSFLKKCSGSFKTQTCQET